MTHHYMYELQWSMIDRIFQRKIVLMPVLCCIRTYLSWADIYITSHFSLRPTNVPSWAPIWRICRTQRSARSPGSCASALAHSPLGTPRDGPPWVWLWHNLRSTHHNPTLQPSFATLSWQHQKDMSGSSLSHPQLHLPPCHGATEDSLTTSKGYFR